MMSVEQSVEWELPEETELLGENLPQCHFVHHKSHMTWPEIGPGPPRWEAWGMVRPQTTIMNACGGWTKQKSSKIVIVFWSVTLCSLVNRYKHLRWNLRLQSWGQKSEFHLDLATNVSNCTSVFPIVRSSYLIHKRISGYNCHSTVGTATGYGLDDRGVEVPVGSRIFTSQLRPDRLWGQPNLLANGYRGLFPRG
jgi:hypothetical protein